MSKIAPQERWTKHVSDALEAYEADCRDRERQAREATQGIHLKPALESRKREEAIAADTERRQNEAGSSLQDVARIVGLQDGNDEELAIRRPGTAGMDA